MDSRVRGNDGCDGRNDERQTPPLHNVERGPGGEAKAYLRLALPAGEGVPAVGQRQRDPRTPTVRFVDGENHL